MMGAGKRDRKIVFRSLTAVEDALGTEVESWTDHLTALAFVRVGTGAERRDAAASGAVMTATFRVLATPTARAVTERFRIRMNGVDWGIIGITEVDTLGREMEFTATRLGAA